MTASTSQPATAGGHHHGGHHHGDHHHGDHHQGGHHHDFKGAEAWAARFNDPSRDAWQRPGDVVALMEIAPGMTVADLGAGTGYMEPHLAAAVGPTGQVLALDVEPDMVRYMEGAEALKAHPQVKPRLIPADNPGLAPQEAHRIVIVNTWHHLSDREAYAARLREALAPGGLLVIVDYTADAPEGPPPAMRLSPEQISAELKAAGFQVEVAQEELPRQYILRARVSAP